MFSILRHNSRSMSSCVFCGTFLNRCFLVFLAFSAEVDTDSLSASSEIVTPAGLFVGVAGFSTAFGAAFSLAAFFSFSFFSFSFFSAAFFLSSSSIFFFPPNEEELVFFFSVDFAGASGSLPPAASFASLAAPLLPDPPLLVETLSGMVTVLGDFSFAASAAAAAGAAPAVVAAAGAVVSATFAPASDFPASDFVSAGAALCLLPAFPASIAGFAVASAFASFDASPP